MLHVNIKFFNKLILSFWWVQSGIPKVHKILSTKNSTQCLRNDMLDNRDIWNVSRTPSHTQSMLNDSTISQEWDASLSWFLYWKIKVEIGGNHVLLLKKILFPDCFAWNGPKMRFLYFCRKFFWFLTLSYSYRTFFDFWHEVTVA